MEKNIKRYNAEIYILGCIINNYDSLNYVVDRIASDFFDDIKLRNIFIAVSELANDGKMVNTDTILDYLQENPNLNFPDSQSVLEMINAEYNSDPSNIEYYCNVLTKEHYETKVKKLNEFINSFSFSVNNIENDLVNFQKHIIDATTLKSTNNVLPVSVVCEEYSDRIDKIISKEYSDIAISTGFNRLDRIITGFIPGDLLILAARPGIGKTSLALNFALNVANKIVGEKRNNKQKIVVIFSIEMGKDQLMKRMVSIQGLVEYNERNLTGMTQQTRSNIENTLMEIKNLPIFIDDSPDLTIQNIRSRLKTMASSYDIALVIVDYLQLVKGPKNKEYNRQQEVSYISRTLKAIARDSDINAPVLALAQLSRSIEKDKREHEPKLSDLRESGSIEQDADIVMFLSKKQQTFEDELEETNKKNEKQAQTQEVVVDVKKNRNGPVGYAELTFHKNISKFQ